ncbi:MAG: DUF3604 domain-containing protein, partial [bacterium]
SGRERSGPDAGQKGRAGAAGTHERAFFGDIHNHCNISYAHGDLEDAIANARQRLDFVSVTGHAHWPDMPERNERIGHIIDFHEKGFAKLRGNWNRSLAVLAEAAEEGRFLTFPGFEVHGSRDGDRAVVYRDAEGELLYPEGIPELQETLARMAGEGRPALALPHHIGYHQGARGINWDSFDERVSPVVEVFSMHGAAETTEGPLPFLHSMGPADRRSTVQYGLSQGHTFGFVADTDHHSAHPGSYGHGMTGLWATELSREAIWQALFSRRTYALTGDRMLLDYAVGDTPMGGIRGPGRAGGVSIFLDAGAPIDYVDVIYNNRPARRVSLTDVLQPRVGGPGAVADAAGAADSAGAADAAAVADAAGAADETAHTIRTKLFLEVGWGPRGRRADWEVDFGIADGELLDVDARFRGPDVLSPENASGADGAALPGAFYSWWRKVDSRTVHFETITYGNPTTSTPGTQGVCLDVQVRPDTVVWAELNGVRTETTVEGLLQGGKSGYLRHEIDCPAWLFHRAPREEELHWELHLDDFDPILAAGDFIYLRVRQQNGHWAWGSPVFVR